MTISDAIRLMLVRVSAEKVLPFEPLNPNATTVDAIKASRRGKGKRVKSVDALLKDLNA